MHEEQRRRYQLQSGAATLDLSIVVPVYRSEDCLEALIDAIKTALEPEELFYEVLLVNDGSPDRSWQVIEKLCQRQENVVGVDLRRNFGQDNAIMTGLRLARGTAIAIMDDDLQHDPREIPKLLATLKETGADVVYGQFQKKEHQAWKNWGSWFNGKVAEWLIGKPPHIYISPYKVLRSEVARLITVYDGPYPYVDGLLFQVTSRFVQIPIEHRPRFAGESTYTFMRSIRVWARLTFSFSVKPLRLVTWLGIGSALLGVAGTIAVVFYRLTAPEDFPTETLGWASLATIILTLGGLQLFFLGILGEYVGRTHININRVPQAVVATVLNQKQVVDSAHPAPASNGGGDGT